jgi:hypothetical protein
MMAEDNYSVCVDLPAYAVGLPDWEGGTGLLYSDDDDYDPGSPARGQLGKRNVRMSGVASTDEDSADDDCSTSGDDVSDEYEGLEEDEVSAAGYEEDEVNAADYEEDEVDYEEDGVAAADCEEDEVAAADYEEDEVAAADYEADEVAAADYEEDEVDAAVYEEDEVNAADYEEAVPIADDDSGQLFAVRVFFVWVQLLCVFSACSSNQLLLFRFNFFSVSFVY